VLQVVIHSSDSFALTAGTKPVRKSYETKQSD
jgi:hypothetical protein